MRGRCWTGCARTEPIFWPPSRALRWLREAGPRRRDTACEAFGPAPAARSCRTAAPPPPGGPGAPGRHGWRELALHDQRVRARRLVVTAPNADDVEPVPPVEALGAVVVHPDLEEHFGAAAPAGLGQQVLHQCGADPLAP